MFGHSDISPSIRYAIVQNINLIPTSCGQLQDKYQITVYREGYGLFGFEFFPEDNTYDQTGGDFKPSVFNVFSPEAP